MGARSSRFLLPFTLFFAIAGFPRGVLAAHDEEDARNDACASVNERGQREWKAGKLLDARNDFRTCSAASCPVQVRSDCVKWIGDVEEEMPSIILRARDARDHDVINVRVYVNQRLITEHLDGGALDMDPGPYEFRCEAASGAVAKETVLLALGQQKREILVRFDVPLDADGRAIVVPPPAPSGPVLVGPPSPPFPPPSPRTEAPNRTLGYVFASISVAALGAFGYFEFQGQSGYSDLETGCGATRACTPAEVDPVRTDFILAGSFLAVSVVSAGLATWQFLRPRHSSTAAQLRFGAGPGLALTTFQLRF